MENPQIQVEDAFGVHMHWPIEHDTSDSIIPAGAPHGYFATCPHCRGLGWREVWPVCVGEPQPAEQAPCELCEGEGEVHSSVLALYHRDGIEGVRRARITAAQQDAAPVAAPF